MPADAHLGERLMQVLAERGVTHMFGIPGVHNLELFRNLGEAGIELVVPRHEQGAGFMADAYSRISGRPGVCALVTGPGVLNALTPIAQAWHDSVPMLVLASTLERDKLGQHAGALHDTPDVAETLRPYTVVSRTAQTGEELLDAVDEIFARWETERPRPAFLGIPRDLLAEIAPPADTRGHRRHTTPERPEIDAERWARTILESERPVIIAGGGVRRDGDALAAFAERIDAPVVLTGNAKGALPHDHPLNLGVALTFSETIELVESADLVIALGTELSEVEHLNTGTAQPEFGRLLRVDIDPEAASSDGEFCLADGRAWLTAVEAAVAESLGGAKRAGGGRQAVERLTSALVDIRESDPYAPWIAAVERATGDETIFAADSAQLAYQSHHFLRLDGPNRWLAPYGLGTLGPALPMAIGAAVAEPDRPVVALAGDGGSLFTIAELATAVDLGRQLSYVIWNNLGYKEIEHSFLREGMEPAGVSTSARDLAAIAAGFGAHVEIVEEPAELERALAESLTRDAVTVIRVDAPAELRVAEAPH